MGGLRGYRARLCCSQGAPPPFPPRNDGRHHSEPRNWEESGKYVSETFLFFSFLPSPECVCVCVCTALLNNLPPAVTAVRSFVRSLGRCSPPSTWLRAIPNCAREKNDHHRNQMENVGERRERERENVIMIVIIIARPTGDVYFYK